MKFFIFQIRIILILATFNFRLARHGMNGVRRFYDNFDQKHLDLDNQLVLFSFSF